MRQEIRNTTYQ